MSSNDDFWTSFLDSAYIKGGGSQDFAETYLTATKREEEEQEQRVLAAVDQRMSGRSIEAGSFSSMQALTDIGRESLALPVVAGTRVQFAANTGVVLSYEDPPMPNMSGVVVAVKSASGPVTSYNDHVFVKWDDGVVRSIHANHLRQTAGRMRTVASQGSIRVASLGDLTDFLRVAGTKDTLVHKATKDLWSLKKDSSGYMIERLFDDTGEPIKV